MRNINYRDFVLLCVSTYACVIPLYGEDHPDQGYTGWCLKLILSRQ